MCSCCCPGQEGGTPTGGCSDWQLKVELIVIDYSLFTRTYVSGETFLFRADLVLRDGSFMWMPSFGVELPPRVFRLEGPPLPHVVPLGDVERITLYVRMARTTYGASASWSRSEPQPGGGYPLHLSCVEKEVRFEAYARVECAGTSVTRKTVTQQALKDYGKAFAGDRAPESKGGDDLLVWAAAGLAATGWKIVDRMSDSWIVQGPGRLPVGLVALDYSDSLKKGDDMRRAYGEPLASVTSFPPQPKPQPKARVGRPSPAPSRGRSPRRARSR